MFIKVTIACSLISIVSGSNVGGAVFNLTESSPSGGLVIASASDRVMLIDSRSSMTEAQSFTSANGYGDELRLIDAGGVSVSVPLTRAWLARSSSRFPEFMSITPGSCFAERFGNTMLVPPSETHRTFRLFAGITDPSPHCYEGTMGYANMPGDAIRLSVQVSVIAATGQAILPETGLFSVNPEIQERDEPRFRFGINTDRRMTQIPHDVYRTWLEEVLTITGAPDLNSLMRTADLSGFIHEIPSIRLTIFHSDDSDDIAAIIVLGPEDLVEVTPLGPNIRIESGMSVPTMSLGLTALKHMSVFLDYENSRIGFCEPI